ncbi:ribose ABC transporter substrate-binding protein RbsB [Amphibiibacter pelophylacis]|uniref:Ribose ABC transporter substrate-binding protein RbsB n=1 Tax=Amphibiibacter pelophylacis TaxID=1799477 RepID=A0ACC6P359_9BURK
MTLNLTSRRHVLTSALAAAVLALSACSKTEAPAAASSAPAEAPAAAAAPAEAGGKVGLALSTLNNPFFVELRDGAQAEAKKDGVDLIVVDAQDDPAKQQSGIEDLLQKQIKVLLINPTDSAAVANVVKEATAKGVKVVSLDRTVEGAPVVSHIASDNIAGGKMAAEFIAKKLGGKGSLIELQGIPGSSAARERGEGFKQGLAATPDLKVVASQPADFDRAKGLSVMENLLQSHKDIQAVFAHNDEMALGATKALEAAKMKDVLVVGFDATPDAVAAVKAGTMAATVQQQPAMIGAQGIQVAKKLLAGETVDASIPVPLQLVTQGQ